MKRSSAALTRPAVPTLTVRSPRPTLEAVILDAGRIRCGTLFIEDRHPIAALCHALAAARLPDMAIAVRSADRSPAFTILSFVGTIAAS